MHHTKQIALSIMLGVVAVVGLLVMAETSASAQVQPAAVVADLDLDAADSLDDALDYLATQQLPIGGFPGWTPSEADELTTLKVVLALAADNRPVSALTSGSGATALDYLETQVYSYTRDVTGTLLPGRIGMFATALAAGDENPYAFGVYPTGHPGAGEPIDLVEELNSTYNPATGAYSTTASAAGSVNQWWALLGLEAAQETVPVTATTYLLGLQEGDGGWGYGFGGDVDTTAFVLQALLASGHVETTDAEVLAGLDFLRAQQDDDGGWGYWWDSTYTPSADSTAAVIQALAAVGYTPATESWAVASGGTPQSALAAFQGADGSFSGNALGTAHAIAGLDEAPLPILSAEGMANRGLSWIVEQQEDNGGFGGASGTADIVVALGSAGVDARSVQSGLGQTPVDYLITQVPTYSADGGEVGKLVMAAVATGEDPRNFGGYNLVISLTQHLSPTGEFGTTSHFRHALAMLGLAAADETVPLTSTQWLKDQQLPDGSWGWAGDPGDTDTTAAAIQALLAAGEGPDSPPIVDALAYLASIQGDDAGFCYAPVWGTQSNADSTAAAVQALLAAGEDLENWTVNGRTPLNALRSFQKSDGAFVYEWGGWGGPVDNIMATYHAVPALLGRPHPITPQTPDDGHNYAGLVIDYDDGTIETACVSFDEANITGHELMELSEIPYTVSEGMLRSIREVSASDPYYWSNWYRDPVTATWQYYDTGFDLTTIVDGSVDGWHFVDWNIYPSPAPAVNLSAGAICGMEDFEAVFVGPDPDRTVALNCERR